MLVSHSLLAVNVLGGPWQPIWHRCFGALCSVVNTTALASLVS